MKRVSLVLLFLLGLGGFSQAQTISKGEYFFDKDPGIGNGTALSFSASGSISATFSMPVNGLSIGMHNLYMRFCYSNGEWGLIQGQAFYVEKNSTLASATIDTVEYFYDKDPGLGNAKIYPISPTTNLGVIANLSTSGLGKGWHNVYMRCRYSNNAWGFYNVGSFLLENPSSMDSMSGMTYIEYLIDKKDSLGKGIKIPFSPVRLDSASAILNLSASNMSVDTHHITIRVRNGYGAWSKDSTRKFRVTGITGIIAPDVDENKIVVYPNPAKEYLIIEGKVESISLNDLTGKELIRILSSQEQSHHELNMMALPSGVYVLRLNTSGETLVRKIFKL